MLYAVWVKEERHDANIPFKQLKIFIMLPEDKTLIYNPKR